MSELSSKEIILNRIKEALATPVPLPFPGIDNSFGEVFPPADDDLAVIFAEEFSKVGGKFIFCNGVADMALQLNQLLEAKKLANVYFKDAFLSSLIKSPAYEDLANCDVSVTGCECLVARTGSMVLSAAGATGRTGSVYAPVHICIAFTPQLLYDLSDAIAFLETKYQKDLPSSISFATGPSRTADIEKTLVTGVHGPKEVYCFLVEAE